MTAATRAIDGRLARGGRGIGRMLVGRTTAFVSWISVRLADLGAACQLGPDPEATLGRATGARV